MQTHDGARGAVCAEGKSGMVGFVQRALRGRPASSAWASEGTRGIPGERRVTSRKGCSVLRRGARPRCWTGATRWSTYPHPHLHVLVVDGVFLCREDGSTPRFVPTSAPIRSELAAVLREVATRVARIQKVGADDDLGPLRSVAAARGTFTRMRDAEAADGPASREPEGVSRGGGVEHAGFNLHAGVRVAADDRAGLERLCRYVARPAVCAERVALREDGTVTYRLKTPRRSGETHRVMRPEEFLARLVALIPPPRFPLVRYHGVCAQRAVAWGDRSGAATGASPRPGAQPCLGRALRGRGVGGRCDRGRLFDPLGLCHAAAPCVGHRRARLPALRGQNALHRCHPRPRRNRAHPAAPGTAARSTAVRAGAGSLLTHSRRGRRRGLGGAVQRHDGARGAVCAEGAAGTVGFVQRALRGRPRGRAAPWWALGHLV